MYNDFKMQEVEKVLGYQFKCRVWLVESLTHKSYYDNNKPIISFGNYEEVPSLNDTLYE